MKLVLLYGAPGTGKYTIAKELANKTGFTLLHNHIILNALSEIFGFDNPIRKKLEKEFRLRIIEEAVKANIDLIVTGVIMRDNEKFYKEILRIVTEHGGSYEIVHLTAPKDVLEHRIENESRKTMNKISTKAKFNEWMKQYPESVKVFDLGKQTSFDTNNITSHEIVTTILIHK
jgi:tRNA uridine 5-carbamoylmethylation protein Kti12